MPPCLFVAVAWKTNTGFKHGPKDSSALLVLLLGAPTALVAFFSQAISSRVTFAVLYGLRIVALLPALLTLAAGAVVLVGKKQHGAHLALWVLDGVAMLVILTMLVTRHYVLHPREQRAREVKRDTENGRSASAGEGRQSRAAYQEALMDERPVSAATVRDEMLERADGLSRATRRQLLGQPGRIRREYKVPPALFFDSAETAPTYVGLGGALGKSVSSEVDHLVRRLGRQNKRVNHVLRDRGPVPMLSGRRKA